MFDLVLCVVLVVYYLIDLLWVLFVFDVFGCWYGVVLFVIVYDVYMMVCKGKLLLLLLN